VSLASLRLTAMRRPVRKRLIAFAWLLERRP